MLKTIGKQTSNKKPATNNKPHYMNSNSDNLKNLPGVDKLLLLPEIKDLLIQHNEDLVKYSIRKTLSLLREEAGLSGSIPQIQEIILLIKLRINKLTTKSLRNVINATGIVVHTNLGRAPFSDEIIRKHLKF